MAGFYGKVPTRGDFVARGLSAGFVGAWDAWLQAGIATSRAALGEAWLQAYLNAPVWRFALGPGVAGASAMLGVMLPSVDKVGRYFPFTVAGEPGDGISAEAWLDAAEPLALSVLADGFELERFTAEVDALGAPERMLAIHGSRWWIGEAPGIVQPHGLPDGHAFLDLLRGSLQP